jgi:hypothetical protein
VGVADVVDVVMDVVADVVADVDESVLSAMMARTPVSAQQGVAVFIVLRYY